MNLPITYDKDLERFDDDEVSYLKETEKEIKAKNPRFFFLTRKDMLDKLEFFLREQNVTKEVKEFILSEIKKDPGKLNKYYLDILMR